MAHFQVVRPEGYLLIYAYKIYGLINKYLIKEDNIRKYFVRHGKCARR